MTETSKKINFFRSCFAADNRSLQIYSFFSSKVSHPLILEEADLLSKEWTQQAVDHKWGAEAVKKLVLYSKEKALYCCALFIAGQTQVLNKKQKLFAPLLLYPAELREENELYLAVLSSHTPILNPAAVLPLSMREPGGNILDEISDLLPEGPFGFGEGVQFKEALDQQILNLNTDELGNYPEVLGPEHVGKIQKSRNLFSKEGEYHLVPAVGLGVINRARAGRGILNELDQMASQNQWSEPLKILLKDHTNKKEGSNEKLFVPTVLNKAQEKLIRKSRASQLNVVVGPPGTGKSFTIAALTIDAISRGESVLIASNNQQAVEVIARKLEQDFKLEHTPIKTTDKKWKTQVKSYLENILSGIGVEQGPFSNMVGLEGELNRSIRHINRQERLIQARTANEVKWGRHLLKTSPTLWTRFQLWRYKRRVKVVPPLWELYQNLIKELHDKNRLMTKYLSISRQFLLYNILSGRRKELQFLLKALRARTGNVKEERFKKVDFKTLFQALPVWLVTLEETHQVLPLERGLFDLVIFDEATQCNIASALPVVQRGKRVVIVGDPKQLRHISFLSNKKQEQLLEQFKLSVAEHEDLDYRNKSLLDFALEKIGEQEYIHFLNEHYRSLPDLIDFSNKKFYHKALYLMTDTPTAKTSGNLKLHQIEGKRLKAGYNRQEAEALVDRIQSIISTEAHLPPVLVQTIGVLSPFREQSDYLAKLISEKIPIASIQQHQILVGTPHFFQGEERDVMLLSFALDNESHPSAFRYLEKADVFNVSITRARSEQHLFISFDTHQLPKGGLVQGYFASVQQEDIPAIETKEKQIHDAFMLEVVQALDPFSFSQVHLQYHISGLDIDIVLLRAQKTYCIDLVGYPGSYETAFPLERIKMLDRMGIKVFSLPYLLWTMDREKCMTALKSFLEIKT